MKSVTTVLCALTLFACDAKDLAVNGYNPGEDTPPPVIEQFSAEPQSVNEGEPVALSIKGSGIDSCTVMANGEKLELSLSLTQNPSHIPSSDTEYEASCNGPGGEIKAKTSINIIISDDIVKADSLLDIGKNFDINTVKALALEGLEGELSDFDPEYKEGTVSLSQNYPESISQFKTTISREHSLLYGYEGYHDFSSYTDQCEAIFDENNKALYQFSEMNMEILAATTIQKEYVIPGIYHIKDFTAVTKSLESPIPQGTAWDVSFDLAQTKISYSENMTDYGEASGFYNVKDGKMEPFYQPFLPRRLSFRSAAFPEGYPVPPKANGYDHDPNHETCNTAKPQVRQERVYQTAREYCSPGSQFYGSLRCETGEGMPTRWPHTHVWYASGLSMDNYVSKVGSNRIYTGNQLLKCSTLFPTLADQYGLGANWTYQTENNEVLFFSNSKACAGFNCPDVEPRLTQNDPPNWNVEPENNYCIDRWKDHPWDSYISSIQALCQSSPVYTAAVDAANQQGANENMIAQCKGNDPCKNLVDSIKAVLANSYFLSSLEAKLAEYETAINEAKKVGASYLIPYEDPNSVTASSENYLVSRLKDFDSDIGINSHIEAIRAGYSSLVAIHSNTGGDWNNVLKNNTMTGISMPQGFQSPEELLSTIESYEKVLGLGSYEGEGLNAIISPQMTKLSCGYEVIGRIRSFSDLKINSLSKETIPESSVSVEFQSIAPITTE
ncbi:MAG: hypothetical protein ACOH5I_26200 [Oligoflexus sp.]